MSGAKFRGIVFMKPSASRMSVTKSSFFTPGFLRIAVPSWGSIGLYPRFNAAVETDPPEPARGLSREELQSLFGGELRARSRKQVVLTDSETQDKHLSGRIRDALYSPDAA